ncbi:DUF3109 family protein [Mangrovivirga cuniculi]|uniref:DUF3109 domain-containing protein n=1 Tax=Mangrovivirga cuniculi TaxID=2715131 RepID=A0A4D7JUE4_9BACT|nr:DUF3109 family protein [Mangrovivirga cuniculi]QCK16222.1 DUF3109 domain-containing protein [Mangrovivirga cuniculi]
MLIVRDKLVSDDIKDKFFVCNLEKCKGACCVEGDLGAPLNFDELDKMEEIQEHVKPYLSEEGREEIEKQGPYVVDFEGDYSTPTIDGKECAYAFYDGKGILKCGIEQAYIDGKIDYKKPISCHLYPIRLSKFQDLEALNYDRWDICSPACSFGKELHVPIYKFLKEPLIRKYGEDWYKELVRIIQEEDE